MSDTTLQVTWDDLEALCVTHNVKNYFFGIVDKVKEHFDCHLDVVGTRYYLVFEALDDLVLFKLKYL